MTALVGGYHAIRLPCVNSVFSKYIYVKKHVVKESERGEESLLSSDRTVYFVNLPKKANEKWIRGILQPIGSVQHVVEGTSKDEDQIIVSDPHVAKTAHVVFKSKKALEQVLKVDTLEAMEPPAKQKEEEEEVEEDDTYSPPVSTCVGLEAYKQRYYAARPGLKALTEEADKYMVDFDNEEKEEIRRKEELKHQVDDDGFVTVVNTKKKKMIGVDELSRPAKKQKSKELQNFYRFQMREKKRDQLKTLRERFEEDRKLVEKMKKANQFKPE